MTPRLLHRSFVLWASAALVPLVGLSGCNRAAPTPPPPKPPSVLTGLPVTKEVTDYEDFTGYTAAVKTVEIRARVSGYLDKVAFDDGVEVKEGALLFEIDPRQYQAEVDRAEAAVDQAEARVKTSEANFRRSDENYNRKVISRADMDTATGDYSESRAMVGVAKANLDTARLALSWTKVYAPISGLLSRRLVDPGNLVKADETLLTTIVSLDPMYVYFDIDERTVLRIRRLIREGKVQSRREAEVPVLAALADEDGFPHRGVINFSENRVDASTGTLRVRAVMENPLTSKSINSRVLTPGLFMRVRLPVGKPKQSVMIAEQALGTDQGRKFLYVVNAKNEVIYRPVVVGTLNDGLRVVDEGLQPNERVIVSGLQRVKPGIKVDPKPVEEPASSTRPKTPVAVDSPPIVGPISTSK